MNGSPPVPTNEPDPFTVHEAGATWLAASYEAVDPDRMWSSLEDLIPTGPGKLVLDIGAGSGRDAAWLAARGLEVVAAEPSSAMRSVGQSLHPAPRWVDDRLPDLTVVHRLGLAFDLILLSAVWMHIAPTHRPRAFRKMITLLKPGGVLIMTLREGQDDLGRIMHPVSLGEIEALARDHGLTVVRQFQEADRLGRPGVLWTSLCLRLPDDGSASLPLIRGVILNDSKSSTYKLALLRAVARIADASPAVATASAGDDDRVLLPLGLVALNWIRAYLPLTTAGLPQAPGNTGPDRLGFAKSGYRALADLGVVAQELRVGATFTGDRAQALIRALGEARKTIVTMPAHFTTYPNSAATVFTTTGRTQRVTGALRLTPEVLSSWGQLSMPGPLWRTMQRLGAWIEPMLTAEWARLMRNYAQKMGRPIAPGELDQALTWLDPARDTALARQVAAGLEAAGAPIRCVWSGRPLRLSDLDIDHALPWSAWPCGDLWNLMPATRAINQHLKRDRLPSATALAGARENILAWWDQAWSANPVLNAQFKAEARAALPIEGAVDGAAVFSGLEWRRLRVRQDQQAPEWSGWRG